MDRLGGVIPQSSAVATSSLMAELVIFNDPAYLYLAIVGAIVSSLGVLHTVVEHDNEYTFKMAIMSVIKGAIIGLIAIPLSFLVLNNIGTSLVSKFASIEIVEMSSSVWLILSFALSWYAVPIWNWSVALITRRAKDELS